MLKAWTRFARVLTSCPWLDGGRMPDRSSLIDTTSNRGASGPIVPGRSPMPWGPSMVKTGVDECAGGCCARSSPTGAAASVRPTRIANVSRMIVVRVFSAQLTPLSVKKFGVAACGRLRGRGTDDFRGRTLDSFQEAAPLTACGREHVRFHAFRRVLGQRPAGPERFIVRVGKDAHQPQVHRLLTA